LERSNGYRTTRQPWPRREEEAGTYAVRMDPRTRRAVTLGVLFSLTMVVIVAALWR